MKAVIYARYSSHMQREESIDSQIRECKDFAEKNNLIVIGEYCDHALSGKTDKRPQFQKMIKDAERGRFEAVIMYTLDRFARNRYDSAIYKARLKKHGIHIYYAKQPMPDTPEGIILESVLEGYAEYYSENLSRNIKRGHKENALKGLAPSKHAPLGYKTTEDKRYEIEPIGAKTVREIFEMYADGHSASKIIDYCNRQGYKTSRGRPFQRTSLRTILKNVNYKGTYNYCGVIIEDHIPPIVSKELFEKVQSMLKHNSTAKARGKAREDYLLTTKVFCGHCGERMVGESGVSRNGTMYHYYKCAHRKRGGKCDKKPEKKKWLEDFVVKQIVDNVLTDEVIEMIATRVVDLLENEFKNNTLLDSLNAQLTECKKKIKNLVTAVEDGLQSEFIDERLAELRDLKKDTEYQIAQEEKKKPPLKREHVVFWLNSFRGGSTEDDEYKRRLIDTLLNSVYIYDLPDGGRKFVFAFNITGGYTKTITCSDIEHSIRLKGEYSNWYYNLSVFGYSAIIESVG